MTDYNNIIHKQDKPDFVFMVFSLWTFILLCRPQDYISFLGLLRPNLSLGLLTLCLHLFNVNKSKKISESKQFRLYGYLIMIMIIGVPFSYFRSASLKDVFDYAIVGVLFFFLFYQHANTTLKIRTLLFLYCLGIGAYSLYILKSGGLSDERIAFGNMFDPNDTAYFVISFLTFNLLFISKANPGYKRIISIVNIVLAVIVILKTGSRGGLISLISVAAYLTFAKTVTVKFSFMKKAVLIFLSIISLLQLTDLNSDRYKTILDIKEDYNVTDEEGRLAIWGIGMKTMLSRPLTGVGMNMFGAGVGQDRIERGVECPKWQTAHNSIVQIGAETGIFGLILFCLMSSNVFKITARIITNSQSEELVKLSEMTRAGFVGSFISSMFLSQAYSVYWLFYIVISSVLTLLLEKEHISNF